MNISSLFHISAVDGGAAPSAAPSSDQKQLFEEAVSSHPFVNKSHYNIIIDADGCVRDAKGGIVAALIKNALPEAVTATASEVLRSAPARTSLRANIFGGEAPLSGIAGYYDYTGAPIEFKSRKTSFTCEHADDWHKVFPLVTYASEIYKAVCPEEWAKQDAVIPDVVRINGTPFSTLTLNQRFRTAKHTDSGDFDDGFGVLAVLEGNFEGLHLGVPDFGTCFKMEKGDVLIFNTHHFHCNTELEGDARLWDRLTCVFYYRAMLGEPISYANYERRLADALAEGKNVRFDYIQRKPNGVNLNRPAEVYCPLSSPFSLCSALSCFSERVKSSVFDSVQHLLTLNNENAAVEAGKKNSAANVRSIRMTTTSCAIPDEGQQQQQLITPTSLFIDIFGDKRIDSTGLPHRTEASGELSSMLDALNPSKRLGGGSGSANLIAGASVNGGFSESHLSPEILQRQRNLLAINVLKAGLPEELFALYEAARERWLKVVKKDWTHSVASNPNRTDFSWNNRGDVAKTFFDLCDVATQVMLFLLGRDEALPYEKSAFWLSFAAHLNDSTVTELKMPATAMSMKKLNVKLKDYDFGGTRYFEDQSPEEQQRRLLRQQAAVKARKDHQQGSAAADSSWLDNDSFDYQDEDVVVDYAAMGIPLPEENPALAKARRMGGAGEGQTHKKKSAEGAGSNVAPSTSVSAEDEEADAIAATRRPAKKKATVEQQQHQPSSDKKGKKKGGGGGDAVVGSPIAAKRNSIVFITDEDDDNASPPPPLPLSQKEQKTTAAVQLLVCGPPRSANAITSSLQMWSDDPIDAEHAHHNHNNSGAAIAYSYHAIVKAMKDLVDADADGGGGENATSVVVAGGDGAATGVGGADKSTSSTSFVGDAEEEDGGAASPKKGSQKKAAAAAKRKVKKGGAGQEGGAASTPTIDNSVAATTNNAAALRAKEALRFLSTNTIMLWYNAAVVFAQEAEGAAAASTAAVVPSVGGGGDHDASSPPHQQAKPTRGRPPSANSKQKKGGAKGGGATNSDSADTAEVPHPHPPSPSSSCPPSPHTRIDWALLELWAIKKDNERCSQQCNNHYSNVAADPSSPSSSPRGGGKKDARKKEQQQPKGVAIITDEKTAALATTATATMISPYQVSRYEPAAGNEDGTAAAVSPAAVDITFAGLLPPCCLSSSTATTPPFDCIVARNIFSHTADEDVPRVLAQLLSIVKGDAVVVGGADGDDDRINGSDAVAVVDGDADDNATVAGSPITKKKAGRKPKVAASDSATATTTTTSTPTVRANSHSSPVTTTKSIIIVEPDAEDVSHYLLKPEVAAAWAGANTNTNTNTTSADVADGSPSSIDAAAEAPISSSSSPTNAPLPLPLSLGCNAICLRFAEMLKRECGIFKHGNMTSSALPVLPYLRTHGQLSDLLTSAAAAGDAPSSSSSPSSVVGHNCSVKGQFTFKRSPTNGVALILTAAATV